MCASRSPLDNWDGVKEAYTFGNIPMQFRITDPFQKKELYPVDFPRSEDCLHLKRMDSRKIAGRKTSGRVLDLRSGGFNKSYGHRLDFDGDSFSKRGVILVTINYRVGIFGAFSHPELSEESERLTGVRTSGNYLYMDQLAALKWVRRKHLRFWRRPRQHHHFRAVGGRNERANAPLVSAYRGLLQKGYYAERRRSWFYSKVDVCDALRRRKGWCGVSEEVQNRLHRAGTQLVRRRAFGLLR